MPDNSPGADQGSELSPRDASYELPSVRVPQSIDGDPYEVAQAALAEYETLLVNLTAYGQAVEAMVRSAMLSEALTLPKDGPLRAGDPATYPERTYELVAVTKANEIIGKAVNLVIRAHTELSKPVADSRRLD